MYPRAARAVCGRSGGAPFHQASEVKKRIRSPEVKRSGLQDHCYQEEGFVMKARSLRTLTGMVLMLVIVTVSSCQVSSKVATRSGARARKAGEVLPLIISRISPVADHFYSTTEKVAIQPSFDPGMINLEAVTNYKLWLKDPVGGTWSQVVDSETIPIPSSGSVSTRPRLPSSGQAQGRPSSSAANRESAWTWKFPSSSSARVPSRWNGAWTMERNGFR